MAREPISPTPITRERRKSRPNLASDTLELIGVVAAEVDLIDGNIEWNNIDSIASFLGAPSQRIPQTMTALQSLLSADALETRGVAIDELSKVGQQYQITYPMNRFDGAKIWVEETGSLITTKAAHSKTLHIALRDVSSAKRARLSQAFQETKDPQTGLWNKQRFYGMLDYDRVTARLRPVPGFAVCVAIDNLALIKANVGDAAEEFLISEIADRLRNSFPSTCMIARLNQTHFTLLLPGLNHDFAYKNIKMFIDSFKSDGLQSGYGDIPPQFSLAGAELSLERQSSSDFMDALISRLSPAEDGFDFIRSDPKVVHENVSDATTEDILALLHADRFALAYQPIIDARTRQIHHYEGLLRIKDDDGGLSTAGPMILAAEETGIVHLLDKRALDIASKALEADPNIMLAINVSAGTVQNEFASKGYVAALRRIGVDAQRLSIELTETSALHEPELVGKFAQEIRNLGCPFAIDDFGAGHTTFQNLLEVEADIIKIDGSMVEDLSGATHKQTFVRMVVDFARTLGIQVVAERVTSETDARLMEQLGVTYFQSYLFGMPGGLPGS